MDGQQRDDVDAEPQDAEPQDAEPQDAEPQDARPHHRRVARGLRAVPAGARRLRPSPLTTSYLLRGGLSVVAIAAATFVVLSLAAMAGPARDAPTNASNLAQIPAALPPVPVPAGASASLPAQPLGSSPNLELPGRADRAVQSGQSGQRAAAQPTAQSAGRQQAYGQWAGRTSDATGIPTRALEAYAYAHAVMAEQDPGCNITWVTLAGVAKIESNHGRFAGRSLTASGVPSTPIIGVPLNGTGGNRALGDTDGGQLDGDSRWDRAVGPFQFIPTTWAKWASDGDGDEVGDPQDIDDAAVAAARYLCAGGGSLDSGNGWLQAVLSYNQSMAYATNVYRAAERYAGAVN